MKATLKDEWGSLKGFVVEARGAAALGSRLTDQLLTFARRRHLVAQILQLNELVIGVADLLRRAIGENISLNTSMRPDLWNTRADQGQFQSALVNLAVNARDAMPDGGKLALETSNIVLSADQVGISGAQSGGLCAVVDFRHRYRHVARSAGPRVRTLLYNQGDRPWHRAGPGNGLRLCEAIGWARHDLQRGRHGNTINLYLPRATAAVHEGAVAEEPEDMTGPATEIILVVEDDDRLRRVTVMWLKMIGYEVLEAHDGPTALQILEARRGSTSCSLISSYREGYPGVRWQAELG